MGGTLDPVHIAHPLLAVPAVRQFGLSRLLFVPAARPPHKQHRAVASFDDRLEMVRLAAAGDALLAVTDIESGRPGPSYTLDTVRAVAAGLPGEPLYFVAGSDSLAHLAPWTHPDPRPAARRKLVPPGPGSPAEDAGRD